MSDSFQVQIEVRGYELDGQGHLNQSVYLQYAEHARWKYFQAAGLTRDKLGEAGIGPVVLRSSARFQRELRVGDEVNVSCVITGGRGRFIELTQNFRTPAGVSVARVDAVVGVIDLTTRALVSDPRTTLRELASSPEVLTGS
ncbi:acyl-CoA thioester hydrolase [Naumannella cuiyingiana]|uniref:Acyl-CoA thioester hydrolase n=1 Tax=Naumannella cuiyingiana TaxID=1347891 RepID=A0A7Z0D9U9_9ACTN|nr:acyl-CoA thioesterase [Naumannella cuiyingiana]NYI71633.1 acyl-CoA thioester hydrolase [Naumannella cuiyingiana]